ncbi:protein CHROMATIN REMODELING 35 isoform X4 [Zea mays]|uniref:Protein CHROMATIN REMODELING 35 n=1 Tax=Zea mays TaxID=4577 RepID=A0A1D6PWG0_MAIZE|nr:protein CHROMATIN REMODELING 35 isoform X3 [Zea mays]XP_020407040.1 protein CHROMATIN REMODELING 35 isoform X4 [Zea mays]XP_020407041.1 protein CHROMATIN REMODELING 35 isoform X3 [Zea mays]XP_020407042.1 protein CHROMATIN REMODELING 35 isoform X4 [Zea mays]AQK50872.1 Protein CHROMATIN REMODELING 35 [Zea mays]AQK50874.1 Protein CHROMATIN REMODELING 35 [Zea mays]AQK50878.1 Protein CHROMATIN REMODELING 35 [Zea mays]AQK50879.1 Protein CHROMATIN REMODELING 35 [Zea mays]AQK50884.1 Protein CHRO|eukprot:XP_008677014.1 protein CHROMATIN REMODELING 35 isoform X3 [Zea mays]
MSQSPGGREGIYYSRQRKPERNGSVFTPIAAMYSSGHALPVANRSHGLVFGSLSKDWDDIRQRKDQLVNFLASLERASGDSAAAGKIEDSKLASPVEPTEQKEKAAIIVLDSDDEDGNGSGNSKLASETNKELGTSGLINNIAERMTFNGSQAFGTVHTYGDKNTQIVPYGQCSALVNQFPLQTSWQPSIQFERVVLQKRPEEQRMQDLVAASIAEKRAETQVFLSLPTEKKRRRSDPSLHASDDTATVPKQRKSKGATVVAAANLSLVSQQTATSPEPDMVIEEEEKHKNESDGLDDYWKDFALAVESTKLDEVDEAAIEKEDNGKMEDIDCNHDIRIHEDLGHVCRVCGMIVRRADSIIDYQWKKASRRRTNGYGGHSKDADEIDCGTVKLSEDFIVADIAIHPRHARIMKPHQLEGFNFLVKNLIGDKPGGCILAHAPGTGKTFMLISFIQSFMARYPSARPLVVLPKGILGIWKTEIKRWQVQDIPVYDFYSVKAEKRVEQLQILKSWEDKMSILFLGYKQFSTIVTDDGGSNVTAACRDRLLKVPNLLILDEGHTPRNRETNVLESLNRVETPRKVVLSGTLFQNHVEEVFNILNLVRPKFLRMESSRPTARRIMSQVEIVGRSSKGLADGAFTKAVEETLLNDENFKRKAHVIRGLRELTKDVLHYYKGDILDELPGLVDFSVFLKLTPKQKDIIYKLEAHDRFKRNAVGSALYIHPCLSELSEVNAEHRANTFRDDLVDSLVDSITVRDGVKANFFMNILSLANSAGEKVLAFSQYISPMIFFERLLVKKKGWHVGKEIFMISGDTSQEDRELATDHFNNSADAKIMFGSIKACGEGISLVGASRVVILDVHLNPSVTRQAIGRAFRPGQQKKVFVYRLVAADSDEVKVHETAFKKEVIPKLWFEWSEHCTTEDFKLGQIDIDDSGDELLDTKAIRKDIKALYRR